VKCAGDHNTKQCTKGDLRTPKSANCLKNHSANYRGCEIAKKKPNEKNCILRKKATRQAEQQQISQQYKTYFEIRTEIKEKKSSTKYNRPSRVRLCSFKFCLSTYQLLATVLLAT
jgi:hypothetical protein